MKSITATRARQNLYNLIDEVSESNEPTQITGKRNNCVIISEDDWKSLQETIYLLSIPKMRESIRDGLSEKLDNCDEKLDW